MYLKLKEFEIYASKNFKLVETNKEMGISNQILSINGKNYLKSSYIAIPYGFMAKSFFIDSFKFFFILFILFKNFQNNKIFIL